MPGSGCWESWGKALHWALHSRLGSCSLPCLLAADDSSIQQWHLPADAWGKIFSSCRSSFLTSEDKGRKSHCCVLFPFAGGNEQWKEEQLLLLMSSSPNCQWAFSLQFCKGFWRKVSWLVGRVGRDTAMQISWPRDTGKLLLPLSSPPVNGSTPSRPLWSRSLWWIFPIRGTGSSDTRI